jgi:apolipoprotein N-acyltransferase
MAVFRAIENRRSMVRATASGQTCGIAPDGKIIAMAPPFAEAWLTVAVPIVNNHTTIYNRWGDFLAICFTALAILLLIFGGALRIIVVISKRRLA